MSLHCKEYNSSHSTDNEAFFLLCSTVIAHTNSYHARSCSDNRRCTVHCICILSCMHVQYMYKSVCVCACVCVCVSVCRLPDGLCRRGDINMLLLGDPGTAKSQLLKFVENVSPIGVSILHKCFVHVQGVLKAYKIL